MLDQKPDDGEIWWRELVSRAAMVVLAALLLAGAAGLFHAGRILVRDEREADASRYRRDGRESDFALLMFVGGGAMALTGLFLLKRSVLPSRVDEPPPRTPRLGQRPGGEWHWRNWWVDRDL